ncbi:MAG: hypothetical protein C4297_03970 [Gemmataceae bacterium]
MATDTLRRRFVILEHHHNGMHYDFMLEIEGRLQTWRVADLPTAPGNLVPAQPLPDHRIVYLDYEGPISGDRGFVRRYDTGYYEVVSDYVSAKVVRLYGSKVRGLWRLEQAGSEWLFSWLTEDAAY